jgi:PAS domain S-box-containing protein
MNILGPSLAAAAEGKLIPVWDDRHSPAALWDALPIAIYVCDAEGRVVGFNRRACELWGRSPSPDEEVLFGAAQRVFTPDGTPIELADHPMRRVLSLGEPLRDATFILERADGRRTTVLVNISPMFDDDGIITGAVNCFQDITQQSVISQSLRRAEAALREQDQRLAATYEHVDIGIAEVDMTGRFTRVNEALCVITGFSRDEMLSNTILDRTHPDDRARDRLNFHQQITGGYDRYSIEKRFIRKSGEVIWISVTSSSVCDDQGRFLYGVRVVQDVTQRKLSEERQMALRDELNHRVKNTLATVQSLAAHTLCGPDVAEPPRRAFEARLLALARTHDQLTRERWQAADFADTVEDIVAPYRTGPSSRIRTSGPPVLLRPQTALTLAMVLHELVTNAVKYGALSSANGSLALDWRISGLDDARVLLIDWRESGGPAARPPERKGFGSKLLEWGITQEMEGRVDVAFEPSGFRASIEIPLALNGV